MKIFGGIIIVFLSLLLFDTAIRPIERMNAQSVNRPVETVLKHVVQFNDTLNNDTLLVYVDKNGMPVKYSRKIFAGVCIKGECRLVNIELFWNVTGSFLGFSLPPGEFLSKTKHNKFTPREYDRLLEVLSDYNSALASYSIKELVPEIDTTIIDSGLQKVDAVTSATIAELLNYIVEGAVYTTYTLWHIIYGQSKAEIEKYTVQHQSPDLILELLNSPNNRDRIWALNHFSNKTVITDKIEKKLIEFISGNDVYLAERSLHALKPELITPEIQNELAAIFKNTGFLQKRLIVQKLKETSTISSVAVQKLSEELPRLNGTMIKSTLQLFEIHKVNNDFVNRQAAGLLNNPNRFISENAYNFLKTLNIENNKVKKSIEKYRRKYKS